MNRKSRGERRRERQAKLALLPKQLLLPFESRREIQDSEGTTIVLWRPRMKKDLRWQATGSNSCSCWNHEIVGYRVVEGHDEVPY